jgi:SWI/SNF-related matrix-associated actin-dependent regulator of chromatin subfamily B protein 1
MRRVVNRPRKVNLADAERPEQLVPIPLEFDVDHHKMRDTFVWNLNGSSPPPPFPYRNNPGADPIMTPENFTRSVVDDYALPTSFHSVIVKSIHDQLSDFRAHFPEEDEHDGKNVHDAVRCMERMDESDKAWWESWRARSRRKGRGKRKRVSILGKAGEEGDADVDGEGDDDEKPCVVEVLEVDEKTVQEDMRILIKVGCFSTSFVRGLGLTVGFVQAGYYCGCDEAG